MLMVSGASMRYMEQSDSAVDTVLAEMEKMESNSILAQLEAEEKPPARKKEGGWMSKLFLFGGTDERKFQDIKKAQQKWMKVEKVMQQGGEQSIAFLFTLFKTEKALKLLKEAIDAEHKSSSFGPKMFPPLQKYMNNADMHKKSKALQTKLEAIYKDSL